MNCSLSFTYEFNRDGDDFGWLRAHLHTPEFSGRNGMWVQWQDVVDFAATLGRFPLTVADPVACDWGFGEKGRYTAITRLSIAPTGASGAVVAEVALANYYAPENSCRVRFDTDYPSLIRFQHEIEAMMRRDIPTATLMGSSTDNR
ncbi:hypothetical protein U1839_01560 [Sphingomonas sp. RT2P30]|uniref:hypothetical protein n=1 Tax=Parasphingomonas halimpatiens TaxID=3096162 RepID=UPI002FC658C1